jgi:hypothetical protein
MVPPQFLLAAGLAGVAAHLGIFIRGEWRLVVPSDCFRSCRRVRLALDGRRSLRSRHRRPSLHLACHIFMLRKLSLGQYHNLSPLFRQLAAISWPRACSYHEALARMAVQGLEEPPGYVEDISGIWDGGPDWYVSSVEDVFPWDF